MQQRNWTEIKKDMTKLLAANSQNAIPFNYLFFKNYLKKIWGYSIEV